MQALKIVPRLLTEQIQHSLKVDRVVALMGPRQAGKTTLARHLLICDSPVQHYNLKDPDVRRALLANARQEFAHYADHLIILDEVQLVPSLLELIQVHVDARPDRKGQFLILGSNHLLLNRQIKESLAGRVMLHKLFPLSFAEMSQVSGPSLFARLVKMRSLQQAASLIEQSYLPVEQNAHLAASFQNFVVFGGFPEFLSRKNQQDRKNWLKSYHQTYLETDLRELVDLRNPESFERFEQLFITRVGSLLNISELARDCGLSADTIRRFLGYYRQLFVAWPLVPGHANIGKRMMKMPKWYFTDTGLARSIADDFRPESGIFFENTVIAELYKELSIDGMERGLCFLRSSTGVEADAVLSSQEGRVTFFLEIKSSRFADRADIRHLKKCVDSTPESLGILVNQTEKIVKMDRNIWSIPAHWLLC